MKIAKIYSFVKFVTVIRLRDHIIVVGVTGKISLVRYYWYGFFYHGNILTATKNLLSIENAYT